MPVGISPCFQMPLTTVLFHRPVFRSSLPCLWRTGTSSGSCIPSEVLTSPGLPFFPCGHTLPCPFRNQIFRRMTSIVPQSCPPLPHVISEHHLCHMLPFRKPAPICYMPMVLRSRLNAPQGREIFSKRFAEKFSFRECPSGSLVGAPLSTTIVGIAEQAAGFLTKGDHKNGKDGRDYKCRGRG